MSAWVDDSAQSIRAAQAYYATVSTAPLSLPVVSIAGRAFGVEAAGWEEVGQLEGLMGPQGAEAVKGLLASVSNPS